MQFNVLALPNNGIQYFGFLNTGIQCCLSNKLWILFFLLKLEFYTLAFPNIGIQCFSNPMLLLFQTLEFWILAFPDIGIQCFAFRKHSNSRILPFQTLLSISVFCLIQTSQFWILAFSTLEFWLFQTLD